MAEVESKLKAIEIELENLAYTIPNLPDFATPRGEDESDNIELKKGARA